MVRPMPQYEVAPAGYAMHLGDGPPPPGPTPAGPPPAGMAPQVEPPVPPGAGLHGDEWGGCDSRGGCSAGSGYCRCPSCRQGLGIDQVFCGLEYLSWYNKGISLPALVTTSPQVTPQATAGVLPGATVVFGGNDIDDERKTAGRLTVGWWSDEAHTLAVVGKLYGVEGGAVRFGQASAGNPILARPFFNVDPLVNAEDALLIAYPGLANGSINVTAANDILGTDIYFRSLVDHGHSYRLDVIGGWQYNRIDSDLDISSRHTQGATTFVFNDIFQVENEFNAGTLGLYTEVYHKYLTFSALGKIGIGAMNQQVLVTGTNAVIAGGTVTTAGGLLTQPTNIGLRERDVLAFSPEVNFKLNCAITDQISMSVGYTFLYWTRVSFAGDQIDRVVNGTQLNGGAPVGPGRPLPLFNDTDFWVQSIDLGVNFNY